VTRTRTGLLIIRAWIEPESFSPLRAQIRRTIDVSRGFDASMTVAQKEAVVAAVQAWLSDIVAGTHDEEDPSGNP
jgi:hypothetical protein